MKIIGILPTLVLGMTLAHGGVVITMKIEPLGDKKPGTEQQILLEKDRVRMNVKAGAKETFFIYRQDKETAMMVNPAEKSYMEMTKADIKKMSEKMGEAMAKMKEAMKNMPPEQRAMMEKMMGGRGMGMDSNTHIEYKKTGSGKVGAWPVTEYDGFRNGHKTVRVSVVEYGKFGIAASDFDVMKDLAEFFRSFKMGPEGNMYKDVQSLKGMPVRTISLGEDGKERMKMEVTEVKKQGIAASEFDIPAGFTQKKMNLPDMGGGAESGDQKHGG